MDLHNIAFGKIHDLQSKVSESVGNVVGKVKNAVGMGEGNDGYVNDGDDNDENTTEDPRRETNRNGGSDNNADQEGSLFLVETHLEKQRLRIRFLILVETHLEKQRLRIRFLILVETHLEKQRLRIRFLNHKLSIGV